MIKAVIVSGSEGLIGKELVGYLKDRKYRVICSDIKLQPYLDLTCMLSVSNLFRMYKICGFVNCAYPKDFESHCNYVMLSTENIITNMILRNGKDNISKSIINLSSIYGMVGPDFSIYKNTEVKQTPSWYAMAKGAIIAYTKYMATKYACENIRVNCISPGGVYNNHSEEFVKNYSSKVPMKRMANPIDICGMIEFLLSERSSYITGQNICIDGGYTSC